MSDKTKNEQPIFVTQRIYVKESTFDSPLTPLIFKETLAPKIEMQVQTDYSLVEPDIYEAVLSLNLSNQAAEKILWKVELKQAGIFTVKGLREEQLKQAMHGFAMNLLYPYACEAISGLVIRSGFQSVYLTPMNFEALYQQQLEHAAETKETAVA